MGQWKGFLGRTGAAVVIGLGMAGVALAEPQGAQVGDNVVQTSANDGAMVAARQAALRSLDTFLYAARKKSDNWQSATLQVALERDGAVERIWVSGFRRVALARFQGRLANEPHALPGLKHGDKVLFDRSQIEDWAFIKAGRGYGFFGVRALLPIMNEDQAEGMRAFLAPDPLPEGW